MGVFDQVCAFTGLGMLPKEYNKAIHGPYSPARYYGTPDTPLAEVKLGEMGSWLGRRNYTPLAMLRCYLRGWHRWQQKYRFVRRFSLTFYFQFIFCTSFTFYVMNIKRIRWHRQRRYHW